MKDKIIKTAIMYPHMFPWKEHLKKEGIIISNDELRKILEENGIPDKDDRRIVGWELDRLIYMAAQNSDSSKDIEDKVLEEYEKLTLKLKKIDRELASELIVRKNLNDENNIAVFKALINGDLSKPEYSKYTSYIFSWMCDLLMFYLVGTNKTATAEQLTELIGGHMKKVLYEDNCSTDKIVSRMKRTGFYINGVREVFGRHFRKYRDDYKKLLSNLIVFEEQADNRNSKDEFDLTSELFGMIDGIQESDINCEKEEEIGQEDKFSDVSKNEINLKAQKEIGEISDNTSNIECEDKLDKIKGYLESIAGELGYKLVKTDENDSKNEELLLRINRHKDMTLLRKLVNINDGAVLSELYNLSKNAASADKENIAAALNNFFATLLSYGVEADESAGSIGGEVTANTKDVLTKFILSAPVDYDGEIKGEIKYYPWLYRGQLLMPLVIKPKK